MVKLRQTHMGMGQSKSGFAISDCLLPLKAAVGATVLLSTMAIVAQPVAALTARDYAQCGSALSQAGIDEAVAADACAAVLHPNDVGRCVVDISAKQVDAMTALDACRRVRRPIELSICVQDISGQDQAAALPNVLEACRSSLLPRRYASCVVGLNQSLGVATAVGLSTCLDASDRPSDVLSTFIPARDLPRMPGFGTTTPLDEVVPSSESSLLETAPALTIPPVGPQP